MDDFHSVANLRRLLQPPDRGPLPDSHTQTRELLWSLSGQLSRTPLRGVSITHMNLSGIDLRGVILTGAVLSSLDLTGADLRGADLRRARLLGVALSSARLSGARLEGMLFVDTNLHEAILGTSVGLSLLGRRDCYICGSDGEAPCHDPRTGQPIPDLHAQRWRAHRLEPCDGGWRCAACVGFWRWDPRAHPTGVVRRRLCPNVPVYFSWPAVPDWLAARPRLASLGVVPDDRVDGFMERRGGRVPLFDLRRLVG